MDVGVGLLGQGAGPHLPSAPLAKCICVKKVVKVIQCVEAADGEVVGVRVSECWVGVGLAGGVEGEGREGGSLGGSCLVPQALPL